MLQQSCGGLVLELCAIGLFHISILMHIIETLLCGEAKMLQ